MRTLVNLKDERVTLETRLDAELAALAEAIASGGDIDATADAAEATEAALRDLTAREYQQGKYLERRAAKTRAEDEAIDALIEQGMNPEDARAEVTGVDVDKLRRREFLAMVRANGITAVGFDVAVKEWHAWQVCEIVESLEHRYRDEFRGAYHVTPRAERQGISAVNLFYMTHAQVCRHASTEMKEWFDRHGRLTREDVRRRALGLSPLPDNDYNV